jgi:hypothetical protein
MESENHGADKRQREERGPDPGLSQSDIDDREILEEQLQVLTALPAAATEEISKVANGLQTKWLTRGRQEAEIRANIEKERAPRTFTSNADKMMFGEGAEALEPEAQALELQHQLNLAELMAKGKQLEATDFNRRKEELLREAVETQMARIHRIVNLAPALHNSIDMEAARKMVERKVKAIVATTQTTATVKFEDSSTARRNKRAQVEMQQHLKQAAQLRNQTEPTTATATEQMIANALGPMQKEMDKLRASNSKLEKQLKTRKAGDKSSGDKKPEKLKAKAKAPQISKAAPKAALKAKRTGLPPQHSNQL